MIRLCLPGEIRGRWGEIGPILAPAIKDRPIAEVSGALGDGQLGLFEITRDGLRLLVAVHIHPIEDGTAFSIVYAAGRIGTMAPRQWLRRITTLIETAQETARQLGCKELRLSGRDWSRFFPDWDCLDEGRNLLRLRL